MPGDSTRWTVIRAAAAGDDRARADFARRYESVIRATLGARWRDTPFSGEVDDATQEVFLRCFRPGGPLDRADPDRPGGFRAFLYGVVRNVARMTERRRARRKERPTDRDLDAFEIDETPLPDVFDREWARALLRDAAALHLETARRKGPDALRRHRLLALRYGEGLPVRDIAARWELDASLVHREYRKARDEFKRALMELVRNLHGGGPEAVERECAHLLTYFS